MSSPRLTSLGKSSIGQRALRKKSMSSPRKFARLSWTRLRNALNAQKRYPGLFNLLNFQSKLITFYKSSPKTLSLLSKTRPPFCLPPIWLASSQPARLSQRVPHCFSEIFWQFELTDFVKEQSEVVVKSVNLVNGLLQIALSRSWFNMVLASIDISQVSLCTLFASK